MCKNQGTVAQMAAIRLETERSGVWISLDPMRRVSKNDPFDILLVISDHGCKDFTNTYNDLKWTVLGRTGLSSRTPSSPSAPLISWTTHWQPALHNCVHAIPKKKYFVGTKNDTKKLREEEETANTSQFFVNCHT